MRIFSAIAVILLLLATVCSLTRRHNPIRSRQQYAESLNHIGGTLHYSTDAYQSRVLVIEQSDGDTQAGRDTLTYLYSNAEVQAQGYLSVEYIVGSARSVEGDEVWVNMSTGTKGQEPWWLRDILA
jgi:hypothetical protein